MSPNHHWRLGYVETTAHSLLTGFPILQVESVHEDSPGKRFVLRLRSTNGRRLSSNQAVVPFALLDRCTQLQSFEELEAHLQAEMRRCSALPAKPRHVTEDEAFLSLLEKERALAQQLMHAEQKLQRFFPNSADGSSPIQEQTVDLYLLLTLEKADLEKEHVRVAEKLHLRRTKWI
jgi:hypothetical protein